MSPAGGAWARRLISGVDCLAGAALVLVVVCQLFFGFLPRTGEFRVARELTGSMSPSIPVGAMIIYRPLRADQLRRRDIISFHRTGDLQTVTHRVISVRRHDGTVLLRTRGDANNVADAQTITFGPRQTVWRTAAVLPTWLASIVVDTVTRGWRLLLSLLPLVALMTWLRSRIDPGVASPRPRSRLTRVRSDR